MAGFFETEFLCGGSAQIKDALPGIGAAVVHADNDALAVALARDLELGAERERAVRAGIGVLVEYLPARSFLAVKALAVIAGTPRNFRSYWSLLL